MGYYAYTDTMYEAAAERAELLEHVWEVHGRDHIAELVDTREFDELAKILGDVEIVDYMYTAGDRPGRFTDNLKEVIEYYAKERVAEFLEDAA